LGFVGDQSPVTESGNQRKNQGSRKNGSGYRPLVVDSSWMCLRPFKETPGRGTRCGCRGQSKSYSVCPCKGTVGGSTDRNAPPAGRKTAGCASVEIRRCLPACLRVVL